MKSLTPLVAIVALLLLALIAYNTGAGKLFSRHNDTQQARQVSCSSPQTQSLFYKAFINNTKNKSLAGAAQAVNKADSLDDLKSAITEKTNIDAGKTLWYASAKTPDQCMARITLKKPTKDGKVSGLVHFTVTQFTSEGPNSKNGSHIEFVNLRRNRIIWFKQ